MTSVDSSKNAKDTVRQTILEAIEAPRLKGINTSDFVEFSEKRAIYERLVSEKNEENGSVAPITSYRNSIDDCYLDAFMWADWVPVSSIEEITEDHLRQCISTRARISPEEYDLALIEREILGVKLASQRRNKKLEFQILDLCMKYAKTLRDCGYKDFVEQQPKLAIKHIMKRVTHTRLLTRMTHTLRIRKSELEANFKAFVKTLAEEAKAIDRLEAIENHPVKNAYHHIPIGVETDSDSSDLGKNGTEGGDKRRQRRTRTSSRGYPRGKGKGYNGAGPVTQDASQSGGAANGKRQRELPSCLLPRCNGRHYMKDCDLATEDEKKKYVDEYRQRKRAKAGEKNPKVASLSDANTGSGAKPNRYDNTALFSATFASGAVECSNIDLCLQIRDQTSMSFPNTFSPT